MKIDIPDMPGNYTLAGRELLVGLAKDFCMACQWGEHGGLVVPYVPDTYTLASAPPGERGSGRHSVELHIQRPEPVHRADQGRRHDQSGLRCRRQPADP